MAYKKRIADELLKEWIESTGCVLVEGSKWCGKTTTAEQVAGSIVYMADTKDGARNVQLAKNSPSYLLTGETPRLIDEWQVVPTLWDAIRGEVDHRRAPGQFIIRITELFDSCKESLMILFKFFGFFNQCL